MATQSAEDIATAFVNRWATTYNSAGAAATAKLYTPDSVLVGFVIAVASSEIAKLLGAIIDQGWNKVSIKVVNAREVDGVVLAACEYTAIGSGSNAGKALSGRSSYVLTRIGDDWLAAMHTAA